MMVEVDCVGIEVEMVKGGYYFFVMMFGGL